MQFEIPLLPYFKKKNEYSAAKDGMRYFVRPTQEALLDENGEPVKNKKGEDEMVSKLALTIWPDPWALNRTDPALCETITFAFTEEGRVALIECLVSQYQTQQHRWQNCPGILDCDPWYPALATQEEATAL